MATATQNTQNKEERENKFLSERIIQKALEQGEINDTSVVEIKKLFEDVFTQHAGEDVRVRAESLMHAFRDYIVKKKNTSNTVVREERVEPTISVNNEDASVQDRVLLQKMIREKITTADLSEKQRDEAQTAIMNETQHVLGTEVGVNVVERVVENALESFKQKHNLGAIKQDDHVDASEKENEEQK